LLAADRDFYLRHQTADPHRIDSSYQLIPATDAQDERRRFAASRPPEVTIAFRKQRWTGCFSGREAKLKGNGN
jgi:hypothetical protein